ncbi:hypothetical protein PI125_g18118, partial [Phytophthora idaei]
MNSGSRKLKAEGAVDTAAICRQLLERDAAKDKKIKNLNAEVKRLRANGRRQQREHGFDADDAFARLSKLWVTGDDGLLRSALAGLAPPRTTKLRMVTLANQPPNPLVREETKQDVRAARTPRKRRGSGYSSAVSNAGTDDTDEEEKEEAKMQRKPRKKTLASMDGHSWWMASTRVGEWRPFETSATRPEPNSLRTSSATTRVRAAAIGSQWSSNQKICSLHRGGAGKKIKEQKQQQEQVDVEVNQLKQELKAAQDLLQQERDDRVREKVKVAVNTSVPVEQR